jgi:F0F1-type ATP synthase assembly protein I
MTIDLPLIVVLIALGYVGLKFARVPKWLVVVLLLLGFQTAHTFIAPAVDSGTKTGVEVVNGTTK